MAAITRVLLEIALEVASRASGIMVAVKDKIFVMVKRGRSPFFLAMALCTTAGQFFM
ncbi:MAG TPA: hypothetical protein VJ654_02660 [Noviherbaspirillum sp.]|nr:hypothetical protein [Noviherbaspirillum sp.]